MGWGYRWGIAEQDRWEGRQVGGTGMTTGGDNWGGTTGGDVRGMEVQVGDRCGGRWEVGEQGTGGGTQGVGGGGTVHTHAHTLTPYTLSSLIYIPTS